MAGPQFRELPAMATVGGGGRTLRLPGKHPGGAYPLLCQRRGLGTRQALRGEDHQAPEGGMGQLQGHQGAGLHGGVQDQYLPARLYWAGRRKRGRVWDGEEAKFGGRQTVGSRGQIRIEMKSTDNE